MIDLLPAGRKDNATHVHVRMHLMDVCMQKSKWMIFFSNLDT